jgi:hypothetical protein
VHTASYRYAEDITVQAGYRVKSARVVASPGADSIGKLLRYYESEKRARSMFQQSGPERAKVHNAILRRYGLDAKTLRGASADVLTCFDIHLDVEAVP